LSEHTPDECIRGAKVNYVATNNIERSREIGNFANIPVRFSRVDQFARRAKSNIGGIDGILLARDDAENHYEIAKLFILSGLPIYIDKPFALTVEEAERICSIEQYPGQIFTCSALRYAREFQVDGDVMDEVDLVEGIVPKDWNRYAIHVIEPSLLLRGRRYIPMVFHANRSGPIRIILHRGMKNDITLEFRDSFTCFKAALQEFVDIVNGQKNPITKEHVLNVVRIIEEGQGKII